MATATPGQTRHFCLYNARSSEGVTLDADNPAVVTIAVYETDETTEVVAPVATTLSGTSDYCTDTPITLPTATGDYLIRALIDYDGLETEQFEPLTVRRAAAGGTTLKQLRRRLMRRLKDGLTLTATAATDGQTFTDVNNLFLGNDKYAGRTAYACDGANAGTQRAVVSNSYESSTLTFRPSFPSAFLVGDEIDLLSERGMGWRADEYHGAINDAIADAAPMGGTPYSAVLDDAFAYGERLTIPDEFETIDAVEYEDAQGFWLPVAPASSAFASGWWAAVDSAELSIGGALANLANGRSIRLVGTATPRPLESDDDATGVNAEWLEARALEYLLSSGLRNDPERGGLLNLAQQKAARMKRQAVPIRRGDAMWVRATR